MKKSLLLLFAIAFLAGVSAQADVYNFQPVPANLDNLDHYDAYEWGIDWMQPKGEITEVTLTFHDIYNWTAEENALYVRLLDNPTLGTTVHHDGWEGIGDYFEGQGTLVDVWQDVPGGGPGQDLVYTFSDLGLLETVNMYAADGIWGFGFDPDCHYFNRGVTVSVTTAVPEPATMLLLGLGLAGWGISRKYFKG